MTFIEKCRGEMNRTKNKKELTDKKIMSLLKEHGDVLKKYKVKRIGLFGSLSLHPALC
jgi:predicted nucleotidyltransferase